MNFRTSLRVRPVPWPVDARRLIVCALFVAAAPALLPPRILAQDQPAAPQPAKSATAKKPAQEPGERKAGQYVVHQSLEVGGRITTTQGSAGMWNTLVDAGSGGRILGQSLEMRSINRARTPLFDTLSTSSFGYGGDANDVSYLNFAKGRAYDFAGSFRRDRQYFDYNLLDNSLNSNSAGLVPEPDSPHLFNTVRRNTDALVTILPLSIVSFRGGFNHNLSQGPSYSSIHEGADALLFQNWSNTNDTWKGGVDVKLAPRTTISYDQFYVHYKGNTSWQLAGLNATLPGGTPVSYGLDPGGKGCPGVVDGVGSPNCNGYLAMSIFAPVRTDFPSEQLRFSTHYWTRITMNGRVLYNTGKSVVPQFNELFNGLTTRTNTRQEIDTGAGPNGQLSETRRDNVNADYGVVADLNKYLSLSDAFTFWAFRLPGQNNFNSTVWAGPSSATVNLLTPLSSLTPATTNNVNPTFLNQKVEQNTILAVATVLPQLKVSGGYRFKNRNIFDYGPDDLTWHENWLLLGGVLMPAPWFRLNANYDHMDSAAANSATTSNTYTRLMPSKLNHVRVRGTATAGRWLTLSFAGNDYEARNDDPLVNHTDHNRGVSFTALIHPAETLTVDLEVSHDDVASRTNICYVATPAPTGAANSGTCTVAASGQGVGDPQYLLGDAAYHAPATFFSGALSWTPVKRFIFHGGARVNNVDGTAEMLNPNMVPGALQSTYLTPFTDAQFNIAREWTWHGNWTRDDYSEQGPVGLLRPRNVHGDIVTLGVKYAF